MKKSVYILAFLALILSACSSASGGPPTVSASPTEPSATLIPTTLSTATPESAATEPAAPPASLQPGELPVSIQLIIGTFKLESTAQPITPEQAANLQPLWQSYKDLTASGTATQEQIDALIQQIQAAMTPEQIQLIAGMQLTRQDVITILQEQGLDLGGGQGQNLSPEQIATMQALRGTGGGSDQMVLPLIDALIRFLDNK